ncbi:peptidase M48 [Alphaproteobacteria bacterium]|nr:peptidase M48 [Alphaproteobacteria bacterium]
MRVLRYIFCFLLSFQCFAGENEYLIIDEESENLVGEIVDKLKGALNYKQDISVYISSSRVLNAAATQTGDIIVNAGSIIRCENISELIAVLAHEVGHVAGGHITMFMSQRNAFMQMGLITMLIGGAAAALSGDPSPLLAGAYGAQIFPQKMALSKMRQIENRADSKAAEAVKKLDWPVFAGFVSMHRKLQNTVNSPSSDANYWSTHPESTIRITKFLDYAAEEKKKAFSKETIDYLASLQHRLMIIKAKLKALVCDLKTVVGALESSENKVDKYALAIALYRANMFADAEKLIDEIIASDSENFFNPAHLMEIKALCLLSRGKPKTAMDFAWSLCQKKTKIYRDLLILYAEAVIRCESKQHAKQAINLLNILYLKTKTDLTLINTIGRLYALIGDDTSASLFAAEAALVTGDKKSATFHSKKAMKSSNNIVRRKAADVLSDASAANCS